MKHLLTNTSTMLILVVTLLFASTAALGTPVVTNYAYTGTISSIKNPIGDMSQMSQGPDFQLGDPVSGNFSFIYDPNAVCHVNGAGESADYFVCNEYRVTFKNFVLEGYGNWTYVNPTGNLVSFIDGVGYEIPDFLYVDDLIFGFIYQDHAIHDIALPHDIDIPDLLSAYLYLTEVGHEWGDPTWACEQIQIDISTITPAPVPEPAALLLFGSGLVGLIGSRKKIRK